MYEDAQKLIESTLEKFDFVDHIAFFKDGYAAVKFKNAQPYAHYFGLGAAVEGIEKVSKK